MKFNAVSYTDEQLQKMALLPDGIYKFKVFKSAIYNVNQKKDVLNLTLEILDDRQSKHFVNDRIVVSDSETVVPFFFMKRLKNLYVCINKLADYESSNFDDELLKNTVGWCKIGVNEFFSKDSQKITNNKVVDFLPWKQEGYAVIEASQEAPF